MVLGTLIACMFILIGLSVIIFAHRIVLWWGEILMRIWEKLDLVGKVPWARPSWPWSSKTAVIGLRITSGLFVIASMYVLFRILVD